MQTLPQIWAYSFPLHSPFQKRLVAGGSKEEDEGGLVVRVGVKLEGLVEPMLKDINLEVPPAIRMPVLGSMSQY